MENNEINGKDITTNKNNISSNLKELHYNIQRTVISKLLDQVEQLTKENEYLKKENKVLKTDLLYILKRVLLNKNEYNNICPQNPNNASTYTYTGNVSSLQKMGTSKSIFSSSENPVFNESCISNNNNNSCVMTNVVPSPYRLDRRKSNSIDTKIESYLNSLYKHNFADDNITGTINNYFLNKKNNVYEELFSSKSRNSIKTPIVTERTQRSAYLPKTSKYKFKHNSQGRVCYTKKNTNKVIAGTKNMKLNQLNLSKIRNTVKPKKIIKTKKKN